MVCTSIFVDCDLGFLSLNTRGLRDHRKRTGLFNWLKRSKNVSEFVLLQETHSTNADEKQWKREWGHQIYFSHGNNASRGVAILCPRKLDFEVKSEISDTEGRLVLLEIYIQNTAYLLVNVYAPNQVGGRLQPQQLLFFQELKSKVEGFEHCTIMLGGDFNTHLSPALDRQNNSNDQVDQCSPFATALLGLCQDFDLMDCWRILNPTLKRYTWRQGNPLRQSRLDYWLISSSLVNKLADVDIKPAFRSDHSMISLKLKLSAGTAKGPGLWKFNNLLLKDTEFVETIRTTIEEQKNKLLNLEDKSLKWEIVKYEVRRATMVYSKKKAIKKREEILKLTRDVTELERKLSELPSDDTAQQYQCAKEELDALISQKTSGAAFRAKADSVEFGEKNSKYFVDLERKNYEKKVIGNLITDEGKHITEADDVSREMVDFYSQLYSSKGVDPESQDAFLDEEVPKLDDDEKDACDEDITKEELGAALKLLPNGKTPGTDGLSTDFYKFWWSQIKDLVHESLTTAFTSGRLSVEQRRGVITLIPKKGKDGRFLKNWRPISLLNTDYKILTKLLAGRMQSVIGGLVHPDQVGYIKGRYIGQNIRTIMDVIDFTNMTQTPGLVTFLDFQKAFDSLEWVINKVLRKFGFGHNFRTWVSTVYKDITSCILNNGFTTSYFDLTRGIRQGCPLSVYLFILSVEHMAASIRRDANIKGIVIGDVEIKIIQMADDTTVFLRDTDSLNALLKKLYIFSRASGLRLNKSKTEALWLGSNVGSNLKPCGVEWVSEAYALGIWFSDDTTRSVDRNFAEKFDKFRRSLNMWKARELSIKGKITVLKTMALPVLLYVSSNLPVSDDFVKQVSKEMYSFVWSGKPEKIKRDTLISDVKDGGLKMLDFMSMVKAQKVMWVKRLLSDSKSSWKAFPLWALGKIGTVILKCQFDVNNIPATLTAFYQQTLQTWAEVNCKEQVNSAWDVRRQSVLVNKNILIDGQYVWRRFSHWLESGILLIHDIVDSKGCFLTIGNLKSMYNIDVDVLSYNGLKNAIPSKWRHLLKQMTVCRDAISQEEGFFIVRPDDCLIPVCLLTNKIVYTMLVQSKVKKPTCIDKWESLYEDGDFNWADIFQLSFNTVRCTQLQILQYKILHRIYPCGYWVSKWEPSTDECCNRCGMTDTIEHFFFGCARIQVFWHCFENWWACNMQERIHLTVHDVIFGHFKETTHSRALNLCILHAKQFISNQIYVNQDPYFLPFLVRLKNKMLLEKYICTRNGLLDMFEATLGILLETLF